MRYIPLGHSDVRVSQLGLGCMGMSEAYGAGNEAGSIATIHQALDRGINFLKGLSKNKRATSYAILHALSCWR